MSKDTFFNEQGVEPFGYVGQDGGEQEKLSPYNCINLLKATVPIIETTLLIASAYIHKIYASELEISYVISSIELSAIHKIIATVPIGVLLFSVHNSIHKQYFLDKWNATFNWNYSRYLNTPYKLRLMETYVFDKCHDPSVIPGDSGTGASTPGISGMHNDLAGLQGGIADEYYHLTLYERNKLAAMRQGSLTYVEKYKPDPFATGDAWVNSETNILQMYYNTTFNDVSVDHSSTADEVDGGYF